LLQQFVPAAVFVDEGLEVVHSRGNVDRYLKLSSGRATLSILKMAREGLLLELRNAITRAKKDNVTVRREHVDVKTDHSVRDVTFEVIPLPVANAHEPYLMIVFEEAAAEWKQEQGKRLAKVEQQLAATTEYLHTVIEDQEATNEELQSANEEILSSNEEKQSTNEELETAKEELQSTNEELSTVNDELRSRHDEIVHANNDLKNLLSSTNVPLVIVDRDLSIRRFTPEAQRILGLITSDVGRPFDNINASLNIPDLHQLVLQVVTDFTPVERNVHVRSGKQYTLRVLPYSTMDNKVDGAVITLAAESVREARLAGEAVLADHPADMMAVFDSDLRVKAATPSFCRAFQISPGAVQNLSLHRLNHVFPDNPELQKVLHKAQRTGEAIAPFTVELRMDGETRRKFECRLEPITLEGGAKVITLSPHASFGQERSAQTGG
jgi:two-component system, chemotaxis family, CheB/CheR fusion protein